ncbi:MAG: hypothetical protein ACK504_06520 [Bacteroidota bacterium]|jgi:GLPGLI family protein
MLKERISDFIIIVSICFFVSCSPNKRAENALDEGKIDYKISVVDESSPMAGFAPANAEVEFKNNNLHIKLNVLGVLNTSFTSKPKEQTLTQLVSFFDIKSACVETKEDLSKDNKDYEIKFEETKETKIIAGYHCKKINASMINNPSNKFDVYYTTDLGRDSINNIGPYKAIKGMLMQYRLKKLGLELCFTASRVENTKVNDDLFKIPEDYKIISREEMNKLFESFYK